MLICRHADVELRFHSSGHISASEKINGRVKVHASQLTCMDVCVMTFILSMPARDIGGISLFIDYKEKNFLIFRHADDELRCHSSGHISAYKKKCVRAGRKKRDAALGTSLFNSH